MGEECEIEYRQRALQEHGSIINPVTGEALDVMHQCISLHIEGGEQELVDAEAFDNALATFCQELPLHMRVWRREASDRIESGTIHRVNHDGTYDVALDSGGENSSNFFARRKGILRDVPRKELETAPLLVLGEPAGGKTTFAKQLVTWTIREAKHSNLLPVMVRICDVARFCGSAEVEPSEPSVWAFLRRTCDSKVWGLVERTATEKRLLLVLDGMDEAGRQHARLEREIFDEYTKYSLVMTSRDMKALDNAIYKRFRRVRVMQLDRAQIQTITRKRLAPDRAENFLRQLNSSPALRRMAINPLLLSVTLAVFDNLVGGPKSKSPFPRLDADRENEINRGLVYSLALDSMLKNALNSDAETCTRARILFRQVAWTAHSHDAGKGTRDFDDALVATACAQCVSATGLAIATFASDWRQFAQMAQNGRLPLLTWYSEDGEDKYRFAHLTFQEFLCAEQILEFWGSDQGSHDFAYKLKTLVLGPEGRPTECFATGWWQQVLQMLSDLASSQRRRISLCDTLLLDDREDDAAETRRKTSKKPRVVSLVKSPRSKRISLDSCIGDRNATTLASLLRDGSSIDAARVTNGGLGEIGIFTLFCNQTSAWFAHLRELDLVGNLIDPSAASTLATALRSNDPPLVSLNVAANRICVGATRRRGYEEETFHSRTKRGGTAKSKLYLDYFHAAWIPDLSGLKALVEYVDASSRKVTGSLRIFDCRSNALTVEAGEILATLLPTAVGTVPSLDKLCDIDLRMLLGGHNRQDEPVCTVAFGPDWSGDSETLRRGDEVMARPRAGRGYDPVYYPGIIMQRNNEYYRVQFIGSHSSELLPHRVVRKRATPYSPVAFPRLEAGGCLLLARALSLVRNDVIRHSITDIRLTHQALALDFSVWNPPEGSDDISRGGSGNIAEEKDDGNYEEWELSTKSQDEVDISINSQDDPLAITETGINPVGLLELLDVLRGFPNVQFVDVRDTIDLGAALGVTLAERAVECKWSTLGVGCYLLQVDTVKKQRRVCINRTMLKDVGMAAVVAISELAENIVASTKAVSSRALKLIIDASARRTHLHTFNGIDLWELSNSQVQKLDLSNSSMSRASVMLALSFIRLGSLPQLRVLDLSNADLMPSCHPHPRTPELFGVGHLCNACATHHSLTVDINLACQICDNDACGAAWRSGDVVEELSRALCAVPLLEYLGLRNTCFTTMDGPVASRPFRTFGRALSGLSRLRYIDLSGHAWSGPKLTRWCAESISAHQAGGGHSFDNRDEEDDDNLEEQKYWRRHRSFHPAHYSDGEEDEGEDSRDDERAYSRICLPLALGWPALVRGLVHCPALEIVRVSSQVEIDVTKIAVDESQNRVMCASHCAERPSGALLLRHASSTRVNAVTRAHFDLASLVLFVDLVRKSPRVTSKPRRLSFDFTCITPMGERRAQMALGALIENLDELNIEDRCLYLELDKLRSGQQKRLTIREDVKGVGLLVAAAIDQATALEWIDACGVDFGDATEEVVEAVERCKTLQCLNGVACGPTMDMIHDGKINFANKQIADAGALLLAKHIAAGWVRRDAITHLDLSKCSLSPMGVGAVTGAIPLLGMLERLDLSRNHVGETGACKLAKFLRTNRSLRELRLRGVRLPHSTTAALEAFGLALEANTTLLELDFTDTVLPEKLASSLSRTFMEKQPTCPTDLSCKLAFLSALRSMDFLLDQDALRNIFGMLRQRRVLLIGIRRIALADMFEDLSVQARDILDRMDSGQLNVRVHTDIRELRHLVLDLNEHDQSVITQAYEILIHEVNPAHRAAGQNEP